MSEIINNAFNDIKFEKRKEIERLVNALEKAKHKAKNNTNINVNYEVVHGEGIKKLFK